MERDKTICHVDHNIEHCPRCGKSHHFKLAVRTLLQHASAVPIFGGPGSHEIVLTCPTTGELFTHEVTDPPGGGIMGPADSIDISVDSLSGAPSYNPEREFLEWIKNSRATATEFCKTMLTISTGAIPVYFAVLKYIGIEQIGGSFLAQGRILPPVLFLTATILFVLAIRPRFATLTEAEFAKFRAKRLGQLNLYITAGTVLFATGVSIAIVLFFHALGNT